MTAAPIAKDMGMYKQLGLNVNVTGNGKVPEAMAAGKMDVGYVGVEGLMQAHIKGAPAIIAANNHLGGAVYLVAGNHIKNPQDLIGKKVALGIDPEKTSSSWVNIAMKLKLPVEGKNYQTFKMTDKDEYLAMKTGKLDGMVTCDPWGSMAEYEKTGRILGIEEKLPNGEWGICCVFAMHRDFATKHPDLARKMILAHSRAIQFIYTNPLQTAKIFAANYMVPEEVALMTIYKKTIAEGRTLTWELNKRNLQDEIAFEMKVGTLASAPKMNELVNDKLLKESGTEDFKKFIRTKVDPVFPLKLSYADWKKKVMARGL
ncbi:MAG: Taurine-binding periplasmic protein precursor [Syntrophorhabdus sp. PtaB.Bin006]|nr:MAG: Taurine-binding periplasmic protein precursor [Syntrophorhabdus sp. PtaB.Bin006]